MTEPIGRPWIFPGHKSRKLKKLNVLKSYPKFFLCGFDDKIGEIYHLHTTEIFGLKFHSPPRSNRHVRNKKKSNCKLTSSFQVKLFLIKLNEYLVEDASNAMNFTRNEIRTLNKHSPVHQYNYHLILNI